MQKRSVTPQQAAFRSYHWMRQEYCKIYCCVENNQEFPQYNSLGVINGANDTCWPYHIHCKWSWFTLIVHWTRYTHIVRYSRYHLQVKPLAMHDINNNETRCAMHEGDEQWIWIYIPSYLHIDSMNR